MISIFGYRRLGIVILAGITAPFTFFWWHTNLPSKESVLDFLIIPMCISSWLAFSISAVLARIIIDRLDTSNAAEQGAAANP